MPAKTYQVLGLMSGSSLDGTDLAICKFVIDTSLSSLVREWEILKAGTIVYPDEWSSTLGNLASASAKELILADTRLGHYFGTIVREFIKDYPHAIDLIACHGHTIFHFPEQMTTTQIGDGAAIVAETGIDTVTQLRSMDLAFGGQGAPLAPLGDKYMYPGYAYYLNLGGIANLTAISNSGYIAFDICPCNQVLNALAGQVNKPFDRDGEFAASGKISTELLKLFQSDKYLSRPFPKSIDNTWVRKYHILPALEFDAKVEDKLCTAVEFIAMEIAKTCHALKPPTAFQQPSMFITGGGALNRYLASRIRAHAGDIEQVLPSRMIIEFKEVSFIALAGLFRCLRMPTLFASVTGAPSDTINGALYTNHASTAWS